MTPDDALLSVSALADGEVHGDERRRVEELLATSEEAAAFSRDIAELRRAFRYQEAAPPPDLVSGVLAVLPRRRPPVRWLSVAAVFAAGAVAGAAFVGFLGERGTPPAAASIPDRVLEAQRAVESLTADVTIREHGWHPEVPIRSYVGSVGYEAPERLAVVLDDVTEYPSPAWVQNDTILVIDEDRAWSSGPAGCPAEAQPACTPQQPRVQVTAGRSPFPDAAPAPLDLVVPVTSFVDSAAVDVIGTQTIDGVPAIGVRITVAQAAPITAGLLGTGNWRQLHPTDTVALWLADETLVPLAMTVSASDDPDRALWAIRHGYAESPGSTLLEVTWSRVSVNDGPVPIPVPPTEPAADAGFRDDVGSAPWPSPPGMTVHRTGSTAAVSTAAWSDGRAWVRLSWTATWPGGRLFGDVGAPVRRVATGDDVVYLGDGGRRVALHGDGVDLVVTGSLSPDELLAFALSLDVTGRDVPGDWPEAGAATVAEAAAALDGKLLVPGGAYEPLAVDVDGGVVTLSHSGPGERGFVLVESKGTLPPPVTGDIAGVTVRGAAGRWTPGTGTLEWVEDGVVVTLRSPTLSRAELLDVAASMQRR